MAVRVEGVTPGSAAEKAGIKPGTQLLQLDGHDVNDGLDYEFYSQAKRLTALVRLPHGGEKLLKLHKAEEYEPLGCEFATYLIDSHHSCRNKCVFCFIDQMPRGMRESLYFKDDDERLSFLFGNYVTLTNLGDKEIDRIIQMRISPVNISVHTANPALRAEMMHNRFAGEVLRFIPRLAQAGIQLNTQLVLCPGINDGDELRRSIEWLAGFRPHIQSIAAVPVGLTKHREGLCTLQPYTAETAAAQLDIMLEYGDRFAGEDGVRLVYPSDEWFLLAGRDIPPEEFYDGYPQLENGVGMWRLLYEEFAAALDDMEDGFDPGVQEADLATGVLAAPLLRQLADLLQKRCPGVRLHVHAIQNHFFGPGVTVTGLLTGQDIMAQLKGRLHTGRLLLPEVLLRAEGDLLLDDTSPEDIATALDVAVEIVPGGGESLLAAALDLDD